MPDASGKIAIGDRFGRLVVSEKAPRGKWRQARWFVLCGCGEAKEVDGQNLQTGNTTSCGCLHNEQTSALFTTHGKSKGDLYGAWVKMHQRCNNPRNPDYPYYGGRGITVDPAWNSFEQFHSDMSPRPEGLTLDRIDNDGPYSFLNCRWATHSTQNTNKRNFGKKRVVPFPASMYN